MDSSNLARNQSAANLSLSPGQSATWRDALTASALTLVTLCAFFGNVLVIVSVCVNRRLRTVTNCFLTSLAVADCLVSVLVLPLNIYLGWNGGVWRLGRIMCDLWVSADVLLCTASILNLAAISVDRYLAIVWTLPYRAHRNRCLALAMVAVVWLLAAVITCPPLLFGWRGSSPDKSQCTLVRNQGYIVYSAVGSFFLPLLVMLYVYMRIFHVIFQREHRLRISRKQQAASGGGRLHRHRTLLARPAVERRTDGEVGQLIAHIGGIQTERQRQFDKTQADKKAAKTLAVVVGCFTICWLPFFTSYLIEGLCTSCHVSHLLSQVFTWLGYANSVLNPLIYAWYNREFRSTFWRLLTCGLKFRK